ncbi:hypothetical protein Y1Q_0014567 [Alligator mississippiensis]|uniref:Uncharacterized protein n=1 Tax=Alligator mississippiensis TaxID=8496 RepID=A0A151PDN0_ALLMI|nr:hypothetical protein Y1Q_0014567 [Alligator mississippiensis]
MGPGVPAQPNELFGFSCLATLPSLAIPGFEACVPGGAVSCSSLLTKETPSWDPLRAVIQGEQRDSFCLMFCQSLVEKYAPKDFWK